jgi:hypothetical protein
MLREHIKILLFLSSYIPLFLIFLIFTYENNWYLFGILVFIILETLAFLYAIQRIISKIQKTYVEVKGINQKNGEFINYMFTYILPFLFGDVSDLRYILAFIILFILTGYIYMKSDMLYMNPVLFLAGYNLYEISDKQGRRLMLIIRKEKLDLNSKIKIINISDNVFVGE